MRLSAIAMIAGLGVIASSGLAAAGDWFPYKVDVWQPPFEKGAAKSQRDYTALDKASAPHEICVSFPHMKDAYWLAVDYGVTEEAKRLGVKLQVVEAGGYTELNKQISQIEDCVSSGAKAVVIGAISYDGLNNLIAELKAKKIVVVDMINGVSSKQVDAKALASWADVGETIGGYLAKKHPAGSAKVKVAWFPGPAGAGFAESANLGFKKALEGTAVEIVDTRYGDTGKEVQSKLVADALQAHPDLDYVAGSAVAAEAAVPIIRAAGVADRVKVLAYYYTPGVDQGIRRGQILAAPTDSTVVQGRIAIDQAVRILEGKDYVKHVAPSIFVIEKETLPGVTMSAVLAPNDFRPVFEVK
ncbi:TMAO reductase system periplasmic protein TorT [Hansschlegelia quercus]|uniref:TMAO reductase system periplasmic protein TorT n=1 Tax=Hansschlegelia quercus TaxID=2528245 RepID=A0A4Q9GHR3_9HYPH|nr:TMAO reductase system periplasmic protein TorT [Hansschlegelia quercus]TBN53602.1 TMAO reductase system periplasmic protein TorT [Hansschlegelia quercus]